ncbi:MULTISPECIES: DNA-directed RNA polymerase subunit alpha [Holospora]|uniref:DNA-directed RNA polymerase subunit alpha n=2 Tax=Holospora TaxID=44747 RepID=A0A061JIQ0_9PROT|nr:MULTISPECIES: DNA-directed RNA polymerase subunit alpha [Holospora]ETZ04994.1 DNA-directed RNA polymerase subunit alpha [Holospora undulata HU1]GAJ46770.1 DNA-directed RNA polymerase subunit alpha [Holospora elegans E1]
MVEAEKRWNELIEPYKKVFQRDEDARCVRSILVEPLAKGFGVTIGSAMRRVLLSSLSGWAITRIKFRSTDMEFSSVPGMMQDVTDFVLNLKSLNLKGYFDQKKTFSFYAKGPCVVTAGMLAQEEALEVNNPEFVLGVLTQGGELDFEFTVEKGRGYVSSERFPRKNEPEIFLDAWFSPVRKVSFQVENARVGQNTDYEKLILRVETNGSVTPDEAVSEAADILRTQFGVFSLAPSSDESVQKSGDVQPVEDVEHKEHFPVDFYKPVSELDLSIRCLNCLKLENVTYVGDLVRLKEQDLMKTPNFGRKSFQDIQRILASMGLTLGMNVPNWPPKKVQKEEEKNDAS